MAFPEWFVGPPVLGAANPNQYQVAEAHNQAEADKFKGYGYKGPYATKAEAQQVADKATAAAASSVVNLPSPSNLIPGLPQVGDFFAALTQANTWIRVAKVVFGGVLLVIGMAHITGASNAIAQAARKVPVPVL